MRYVKARELKVGDEIRYPSSRDWYKAMEVTVGASKVAVEAPSLYANGTVLIEFPAHGEVLVKNDVPVTSKSDPEAEPWYFGVNLEWGECAGGKRQRVRALLADEAGTAYRWGSWRSDPVEATTLLAEALGCEVLGGSRNTCICHGRIDQP